MKEKKKPDLYLKNHFYFRFINPILSSLIIFSLVVFFLTLFAPVAFILNSILGDNSLYVYPVISFVLILTILIKTLLISFLFKLRGDYYEDFLLLNFIAALFLYLNIYSQPSSNFIQQLSSSIGNLVISIPLILNGLTTVVSQNILPALTFQFPDSINDLGFLNPIWIISRLNAIFMLFSLSVLTIRFFLANITLRIKMIFRKMFKNRYIIFTDESPENLLDLIRNMKKHYLRIYIDEENEFTKVGQEYKKRLESNGLHVISIGREENVIRGIFFAHLIKFNPFKLKNLYISLYKDINENRNFTKNFNSILDKLNKELNESKGEIDKFFIDFSKSSLSENNTNLYDSETHKSKQKLINKYSNIVNLAIYNRLVSLNNQKNPKVNYLLTDKQNNYLLHSMINPSYISAYLFIYDFINELLPTIKKNNIKDLNIVFVGKNTTNSFLQQIFDSLIFSMSINVKTSHFNYEIDSIDLRKQKSNNIDDLEEENYYINEQVVDTNFDRLNLNFSDKVITLFLIDNLNGVVNESVANYLSHKIKEKQKNIKGNKSIFLIFYKHYGYNSPLNRNFNSIKVYIDYLESLHKSEHTSHEKALDNFISIQTLSMKSSLSEIDYFIFEISKSFLASYLTENFNSLLLSDVNSDFKDDTSSVDLDKSWGSFYYFIFDKKLTSDEEEILKQIHFLNSADKEETNLEKIRTKHSKQSESSHKTKSKNTTFSFWEDSIYYFLKDVSFSEMFENLLQTYFKKKKKLIPSIGKLKNIVLIYALVNFYTLSTFDEIYYYYEKLLIDKLIHNMLQNGKETKFSMASILKNDEDELDIENSKYFSNQINEILIKYFNWLIGHFSQDAWAYKNSKDEIISFLASSKGKFFNVEESRVIIDIKNLSSFKNSLFYSIQSKKGEEITNRFSPKETKDYLSIIGPIIYRLTHQGIFDVFIDERIDFKKS